MEYTNKDDRGRQVTMRVRYFHVPQFINDLRLIYPQVIRTAGGNKRTLKFHINLEELYRYVDLEIKNTNQVKRNSQLRLPMFPITQGSILPLLLHKYLLRRIIYKNISTQRYVFPKKQIKILILIKRKY